MWEERNRLVRLRAKVRNIQILSLWWFRSGNKTKMVYAHLETEIVLTDTSTRTCIQKHTCVQMVVWPARCQRVQSATSSENHQKLITTSCFHLLSILLTHITIRRWAASKGYCSLFFDLGEIPSFLHSYIHAWRYCTPESEKDKGSSVYLFVLNRGTPIIVFQLRDLYLSLSSLFFWSFYVISLLQDNSQCNNL